VLALLAETDKELCELEYTVYEPAKENENLDKGEFMRIVEPRFKASRCKSTRKSKPNRCMFLELLNPPLLTLCFRWVCLQASGL
jgi:hypothetical protein